MKIYILIPVHNRKQITLQCLNNLQQCLDLESLTIVVIDDGSTDGTRDAIQTLYPHIKVLRGDGNLWWTGATALGMKYAFDQNADYIVWLNDDCRLSPNVLKHLVEFCSQQSKSIVGAQGLMLDDPTALAFGGKRKTWRGYRYIRAESGQVMPCDLLSGNVVCMPRTVIDEIGYPNACETPHYGGDSLYLLRAHKAGFQLYVDARGSVWNLPGEPKLYPSYWLTCEGKTSRLLDLTFNRYSGLSWRLWLRFNWEAYSIWGLIMFSKKYLSILLISILRLTPLSFRKRLTANP